MFLYRYFFPYICLPVSCLQVETFERKLKEKEAEAELLHQQLGGKRMELKDAWSKAEEHQETAAIFKQKYTAAIEKARRTQAQLERLQEELQYSQQQVAQHSISIRFRHSTLDRVSVSRSAERIPVSNVLSAGRTG